MMGRIAESEVIGQGLPALQALLQASAARHAHLCPRQVLGVRLALLAGQLLDLALPQTDKRLLTIVETDGCAADGVEVGSGCAVGRRTLRVEDYGKVAATFIDTRTGRAVRIVPRGQARALALAFAPECEDRWHGQLVGYQRMPDVLLLDWQWVELLTPIARLVSQPGLRTECRNCGEEILNEREVIRDGTVLCRACAGHAYYRPTECAPALRP